MEVIASASIDSVSDRYDDEMETRIIIAHALGFRRETKTCYRKLIQQKKRQSIAAKDYVVITNATIMAFIDQQAAKIEQETTRVQDKPRSFSEEIQIMFERRDQRERSLFEYGIREHKERHSFRPVWVKRLKIKNKESYAFWAESPLTEFHVYHDGMFKAEGIDGKNIVSFNEFRIKDIAPLPSLKALKKLERPRRQKIFDYFSIGNASDGTESALFGRINEDHERRWFIAQWGV